MKIIRFYFFVIYTSLSKQALCNIIGYHVVSMQPCLPIKKIIYLILDFPSMTADKKIWYFSESFFT